MIRHIAFAQPIWVLGTSKHEDQFHSRDGWDIREEFNGVTLHHPGAQNVPEVPKFRVVGVGYCVRDESGRAASYEVA